jgi:hypothetical protein
MDKDPGNAPYRDERGLGKPLMIDKAAAAEEQHMQHTRRGVQIVHSATGKTPQPGRNMSHSVGNLRGSGLINIAAITRSCHVCCNYRPME